VSTGRRTKLITGITGQDGACIGDASKAHNGLGWKHETGFETLVAERVAEDLVTVSQEARRRGE